MVTLLGALLVLTGGSAGPGMPVAAFSATPCYTQSDKFLKPSITTRATTTVAVGGEHGCSSISRFARCEDRATAVMLSGGGGDGGRDVAPPRNFAPRIFRRGGDGSHPGSSGSKSGSNVVGGIFGGLDSDSGSSGPPRSGGLGRGGGDGGGGWGNDGENTEDSKGDMMALGAAHVMMMASDDDDADSSQPESTLRGGYRRRSVFGRRPVQHQRQAGGSGGQGGITATNLLLALNAIVYLFQMRYPAITKAGWKMAPAITQQGQWYRLLTPIVLHGSFTHLAVNSMSFSSVGPVVERVMGKAKFVTVYTLAGIAGNVLSCIVNPRTPSVGASGAIFGMVGAWGAFCLMNETVLGRNNSQRALRNVAQTVMINVVYGMGSSQIDNMGHLGGFLGGAAMTFLIGPRFKRRLNPYTGQPYIVDESFKLGWPRLGKSPPAR
ncbi:unnamed protein product [Ectocarpus sp. 12 AP-2014]